MSPSVFVPEAELVIETQDQVVVPPEIQQLHEQVEALQAQLLQAQKLGSIGELASSITHEFNNILTTIINYAKLGLRHQDQASRDKAFDKILSAGQRAAKITTGLLSYARNKGPQRESTSLLRIARDVLVLVEKDLHVNRIHCDLQSSGEAHAEVNVGEIQQVLVNLIINARQAMRPGGSLTIQVVENLDEQMAEISVKDNGSGIPADKLPHIFTRFYTTKTADAQGQGGTGLGLALCKNVIEAHGGRIRVESAVGHGTKFTLKFPLAAPPNIAKALGTAAASQRPPRDVELQRTTI